jgi:hypothetical protein
MIGKKTAVVAICAALLFAALTNHVHAQACLGVPTGDGSFTPQFTIGLQDNITTFSGGVTANFAGPLSLQGSYAATDYASTEADDKAFGAQAAYEVPGVQFSMCPFIGGGYGTSSVAAVGADYDENRYIVPVGVGFGKTLSTGPNTAVTFFGTPRFVYVRHDTKILSGGTEQTVKTNDTLFATDLGIRFALRSAFIGSAVSLDTEDTSDTVVLFTIGFGFGGSR